MFQKVLNVGDLPQELTDFYLYLFLTKEIEGNVKNTNELSSYPQWVGICVCGKEQESRVY